MKILLCATALVASIATSALAQSNVYSLNVVGYVNLTIPLGYSLIANPLNAGDNSISNLFTGAPPGTSPIPPGTTAFSWNGSYFAANRLDEFNEQWDNPQLQFPPGLGFFMNSPAQFTNTFIGEVLQGSLTNILPIGYKVVASQVPQAGFVQDLGLNACPGDTIWMWNGSFFQGIRLDEFGGGWQVSPPFPVDNAKGPFINIGQSFFFQKSSDCATWVRNFTVQ